ncbi:MAG: hypothetical protein JSU92_11730 [Deltaproteobacteria bacterium]|nr:MAG: hypothetical protein JSU92_11730 [Deltaproteobacteria bacterium]
MIEKEYIEIIPHGRTIGSIFENWLTPAVFLPVETGGLSRVDSPRFTCRGISWVEQNWRLNGIDITDPFRSGFPLFGPAWDSLKGIQLRSFQENNPYRLGVNWIVDLPETADKYRISYNSIFPAGGGLLISEGIMDREPSYPYGSPKERRRYKFSSEVSGSYSVSNGFYSGIEALITERKFPTLLDEGGNLTREEAEKITFTSIYRNNNLVMPLRILFLTQYNQNDNFGANLRLNQDETLSQKNFALHLQSNARKELSKGELEILSGLTTRLEKREPHLKKPRIIEFDTESGPVPDAGNINRINFNNSLARRYGVLNFEIGTQLTGVFFRPEIPFSQTVLSYTDPQDGSTTVFVTNWDKTRSTNEFVGKGKFSAEFSKIWGFFSLSGNVYLDTANAYANGKSLLHWLGAGGKVLSKFFIDKTGTTIGIGTLHQPSKLNSYIVGYLNSKRPSGKQYRWTDLDGNGITETSELGDLVATTGGIYHHKGEDLKRPYHDEFFFSIKQGIGRHLEILLQGAHRVFSNYFIVNYGSYDGDYTTIDGFELYNKPLGEDEYYLSNYSEKRSHYSGIEIQLLSEWERLYLNFMTSAFLVRGFAPIGNGPDFNDYAVISEDTASPNSRINAVGRLDSDRAYMSNLLIGYRITRSLSFGSTVKYRDGEPFSQHRIYEDMNGIPVRVIRKPRGEWEEGGTRYTFSWNIDLRLRYAPTIRDREFLVVFDMYNLIGSATEILESYRVEDERESLEAVPPRMIKLQVSHLF